MTQEFDIARRTVAAQLRAILAEITKLKDPQEKKYFGPLFNDAAKHLRDINRQLMIEEYRKRLHS